MQLKLKHFEGYDTERLLNYVIITQQYTECASSNFRIILGWISLFFHAFFRLRNFEVRKLGCNSKVLLLYPFGEKCRSDIDKMIRNVAHTIPNNRYDVINWDNKVEISLGKVLVKLRAVYVWNRQIKTLNINTIQRQILLNLLLCAYDMKSDMNHHLDIKKYKLALVHYDAPFLYNFFVQYMKIHGCKTATMQHGVMLARREEVHDNMDFCGVEFSSFVSDYFLAWNDFSKKEAMKMGINEERIKVLGNAKCLGEPIVRNIGQNTIGIILDGIYDVKKNLQMIQIIDKFAKEHGYKYIIRLHPNDSISHYDNMRDHAISTICPRNMRLEDFFSNISFCVVANSTVLFELEYHRIPFVRYSNGGAKDKFKDYHNLISFNDDFSFGKSVAKIQITNNVSNENKDIERYENFFNEMICDTLKIDGNI